MNRLLQRLKGPVDGWSTPAILQGLPKSKAGFQCQLMRELTQRGDPKAEKYFLAQMANDEAGIRRAAARGLGSHGQGKLVDKWLRKEPCTSVKIELARAWISSGGAPQIAHNVLKDHADRSLLTHAGHRQPALIVSHDYESLLRTLTASLQKPNPAPESAPSATPKELEEIAHQGRPGDFEYLRGHLKTGGRRMEHLAIRFLGIHGDPRSLKLLCALLSEMSVDPARGFAHRRMAATALGRLGLKEAGPALLRALRQEPADHEGRPGAGLGIQYPVRTNIIWALGEIQEARAIPALIDLLDDDAGSPLGGFYIGAMDALLKIGPKAEQHLRKAALCNGKKGINAKGVLKALEERQQHLKDH
jgi:hypothetical protein